MELAIFKIGGGPAEDKVDISLKIAVFIVMAPVPSGRELAGAYESVGFDLLRRQRRGKQCVLAAQEAAVFKGESIPVGVEGQGLSYPMARAGAILKGKIFHRDIIGGNPAGVAAEGAQFADVCPGHPGEEAAGEDRLGGGLANKGEVWAGKCHLARVDPIRQKDRNGVARARRGRGVQNLYSFIQRKTFAVSAGGDKQGLCS